MLEKLELNHANNVTIVEKALWPEPGLRLRISDDQVGSSIGAKRSEVIGTTLDELQRELTIKPSILKTDVEGAEVAALLSGKQALQIIKIAELEVHDQLDMKTLTSSPP
ncbi:FkbM family methyltransferase [Tardisphaera miroshnichenkoae]